MVGIRVTSVGRERTRRSGLVFGVTAIRTSGKTTMWEGSNETKVQESF